MSAALSDVSHSASAAARDIPASVETLIDEAMKRYKARCFWNCAPPKTLDGVEAVRRRLQTYGDMEAWRLAERIRLEMSIAER